MIFQTSGSRVKVIALSSNRHTDLLNLQHPGAGAGTSLASQASLRFEVLPAPANLPPSPPAKGKQGAHSHR